MNPEDVRLYRDRWKAVAAFEREELRSLSMEARLQKMNTVWRLAKGLGFSFEPDASEMEVFMRWAALRERK